MDDWGSGTSARRNDKRRRQLLRLTLLASGLMTAMAVAFPAPASATEPTTAVPAADASSIPDEEPVVPAADGSSIPDEEAPGSASPPAGEGAGVGGNSSPAAEGETAPAQGGGPPTPQDETTGSIPSPASGEPVFQPEGGVPTPPPSDTAPPLPGESAPPPSTDPPSSEPAPPAGGEITSPPAGDGTAAPPAIEVPAPLAEPPDRPDRPSSPNEVGVSSADRFGAPPEASSPVGADSSSVLRQIDSLETVTIAHAKSAEPELEHASSQFVNSAAPPHDRFQLPTSHRKLSGAGGGGAGPAPPDAPGGVSALLALFLGCLVVGSLVLRTRADLPLSLGLRLRLERPG